MSDENGGARTGRPSHEKIPNQCQQVLCTTGDMLGPFSCDCRARRYPRGLLQKSDAIIGSDL